MDRGIGTEADTAADMAGMDTTRTTAEIRTSERALSSVVPSVANRVHTSGVRLVDQPVVAAVVDEEADGDAKIRRRD